MKPGTTSVVTVEKKLPPWITSCPDLKSGSSNRNNLLPACRRCNASKASMDMKHWFSQQEFYTEEKMKKIEAWIEQELIDIFVYTTFQASTGAA